MARRSTPIWRFDIDAYDADTEGLSDAEHGVYLRLLMMCWRSKDGTITADLRKLRPLFSSSKNILRKVIGLYFEEKPEGRLTQKRIQEDQKLSKIRSKTGSENARRRWDKPQKSNETRDASRNANGNANGNAIYKNIYNPPLDRRARDVDEDEIAKAKRRVGTYLESVNPAWATRDLGMVRQWVVDKCDLDRDIMPTIEAMTRNGAAERARDLRYFSEQIYQRRDRKFDRSSDDDREWTRAIRDFTLRAVEAGKPWKPALERATEIRHADGTQKAERYLNEETAKWPT